jgi:hypothetical protein
MINILFHVDIHLAAVLCSKWLIHDPNWLLESRQISAFAQEDRYGFRKTVSVLHRKCVCLTSAFVKECEEKRLMERIRSIHKLVEMVC